MHGFHFRIPHNPMTASKQRPTSLPILFPLSLLFCEPRTRAALISHNAPGRNHIIRMPRKYIYGSISCSWELVSCVTDVTTWLAEQIRIEGLRYRQARYPATVFDDAVNMYARRTGADLAA